MPTLYTDDVRRFVRSRPWPLSLRWEIVDYDDYLALRLFRDNFNSFDGEERYHIAMIIKETLEKIRADGIPIYLEKEESAKGRNGHGT